MQHAAVLQGVQRGLDRINLRLAEMGEPINGWQYPLDLRGGREILAGGGDAYLRRAVSARFAIWGPPAEEVVYMTCEQDGEGRRLDGAQSNYTLRFDCPIPARGFWSFTVYDAQTRLLTAHPSGRYKRGDRDRDMKRGDDGSLTLYLQHDAPDAALKANWLPLPKAGFQLVARLYWPDPIVLARDYEPPPVRRANANAAA
jgi:hypothetical protein